MTPEHKAALREGRTQARIIKQYLESLEHKGNGRRRSPERLRARLEKLQAEVVEETDPLRLVELRQEILDTEKLLVQAEEQQSSEDLEKEFISVAAAYSERKGISYTAWRQVGVPARVLSAAGIRQERRRRN